jgi:hypothetical protein
MKALIRVKSFPHSCMKSQPRIAPVRNPAKSFGFPGGSNATTREENLRFFGALSR